MLIPVILSGGAGTRLWPVSREGHPKPFMKLADGQSLLLKTYLRAANVAQGGEILTVTNRDYFFMSKDELARAGLGERNPGVFMLEPVGRNTAPAVAMAALYVAEKHGRDALLLVLAADHLIKDQPAFARAVADAASLAAQDYLVTFGIVPDAPETGFGYIESGEALGAGKVVKRFVEKPSHEKAQEYLAAGNFLWNSGMFCFKAGAVLDELAQHAPDVLKASEACWAAMSENATRHESMLEIPAEAFAEVPDISVDYAIMERSTKVAVVPANFGWSDIGSWNAVSGLVAPDADNNRAVGEAIFVDSKNTFIQSEDRLVAAVGPRQPDDHQYPGCPAGCPPGQGAGCQEGRYPAQEAESRRLQAAPHRRPPVGHLHRARGRPALQDQAHRSQARRQPQPADAPPPQRTLDRRQRHGAGASMATRKSSSPPTNPPTSPPATSTAWKTPAYGSGHDRGAERRIPGRGRHRPFPGCLRALLMKLTCFKAYDIRGRLGDELNEDIACRIGRAYGELLKPRRVVVGGDVRLTSEPLKQALAEGLMDGGADVIDIGLAGTEEVYFAAFHLDVDGGIEVTASHNPMDYNGMKLVRGGARPISGDTGLKAIRRLAEANASPRSPGAKGRGDGTGATRSPILQTLCRSPADLHRASASSSRSSSSSTPAMGRRPRHRCARSSLQSN